MMGTEKNGTETQMKGGMGYKKVTESKEDKSAVAEDQNFGTQENVRGIFNLKQSLVVGEIRRLMEYDMELIQISASRQSFSRKRPDNEDRHFPK
jgi:hypothetical protein